jgi:iron complex transport system permease protein
MSATQEAYKKFIFRKTSFMVTILLSIILLTGIIITLGPLDITVVEAYGALLDKFYPDYFNIDDLTGRVIWSIRFPRIIGGIIAGIGLGVAGCVMQAVLKNPLASPFTLGISAGAHFGVSLAIVTGISILGGPYLLIGNAFFFALLCSGFIIALSAIKGATSETMILAGIAVNYFFGALSQLFRYFASDEQLRLMTSWGMGSLATFSWNKFPLILTVLAICVPLLIIKAWDLNIMTSGDEAAKSVGVDANNVRIFTMVVASLVVAIVVCFTGTISFIGLVAPHMARMLIGGDHRFLIPASGVLGALVLISADAVAMHIIAPIIIPTGVMTSLIGVPFFVYLIMRRKRREFWT